MLLAITFIASSCSTPATVTTHGLATPVHLRNRLISFSGSPETMIRTRCFGCAALPISQNEALQTMRVDHLFEIGHRGDLDPVQQIRVMGEPPIRGVRIGQVAQYGVVLVGAEQRLQAGQLRQHVGVGDLDALGRPGGARGVDHRVRVQLARRVRAGSCC